MDRWSEPYLFIILLLLITIFLILLPYFTKIKWYFFKNSYFDKLKNTTLKIEAINKAILELSEKKIGAIITIANKQDLSSFKIDGIKLNADLSSELIMWIFDKNSYLHDGAIIIKDNNIIYAGAYYKITLKSFNNQYGARHRAGFCISEQTDSLTIVVSEETGKITFFKKGKIINIKKTNLQKKLIENL